MKIISKIISLSCLLLVIGCQSTSDMTQSGADNQLKVQTSVQLWSVKDDIKADFKGTLKQIAAMGFDSLLPATNS